MTIHLRSRIETIEPTPPDQAAAQLALMSLDRDAPLQLHRDHGTTIQLPSSVARVLFRVLSEMAKGNAVSLIPIGRELSTQEAADLLGVSRPFIVKQVAEGRLAHRTVGRHRRIRLGDLMAYQRAMDESARAAMRRLVEDSQELGL